MLQGSSLLWAQSQAPLESRHCGLAAKGLIALEVRAVLTRPDGRLLCGRLIRAERLERGSPNEGRVPKKTNSDLSESNIKFAIVCTSHFSSLNDTNRHP